MGRSPRSLPIRSPPPIPTSDRSRHDEFRATTDARLLASLDRRQGVSHQQRCELTAFELKAWALQTRNGITSSRAQRPRRVYRAAVRWVGDSHENPRHKDRSTFRPMWSKPWMHACRNGSGELSFGEIRLYARSLGARGHRSRTIGDQPRADDVQLHVPPVRRPVTPNSRHEQYEIIDPRFRSLVLPNAKLLTLERILPRWKTRLASRRTRQAPPGLGVIRPTPCSIYNCKAHELDNLYVTDASFFPSIGAVNPTLTIIANALRVAAHIQQRLGV